MERSEKESGVAYQDVSGALWFGVSIGTASTKPRCVQSRAMDVGAVLRRVVDGEQEAWDEIVEGYGGLVWSVARGYRLGALTDDVVQTVWLRLAEYCDRIREPDRLASWLATTTRNEALRVVKKQQKSLSIADYPEAGDDTVSTLDEIITDDDTLTHVLQAFAELPEKDQALLRLLCTVPPLDYATVAELLGRSIGSIGPSRNRAIAKLRKLLPSGLDDSGRGRRPHPDPTAPDTTPPDRKDTAE